MEQIKHSIRINPNWPAFRWRIGMITHRINQASLWGILHPHCACLAALAVSAAFLVSYLIYHAIAGSVPFTYPGAIRYVYYTILLSHVLLAFTVPFLALAAAWQGAGALAWRAGSSPSPEKQEIARQKHLKIVRWAYPIWLYVSVTGVIVYAMLYHIWPSSTL